MDESPATETWPRGWGTILILDRGLAAELSRLCGRCIARRREFACKPDAGNPHVRFDEGSGSRALASLPLLLYRPCMGYSHKDMQATFHAQFRHRNGRQARGDCSTNRAAWRSSARFDHGHFWSLLQGHLSLPPTQAAGTRSQATSHLQMSRAKPSPRLPPIPPRSGKPSVKWQSFESSCA